MHHTHTSYSSKLPIQRPPTQSVLLGQRTQRLCNLNGPIHVFIANYYYYHYHYHYRSRIECVSLT